MWLEGKLLMENQLKVRHKIKAQDLEKKAPDVIVNIVQVEPVL